MAEILRTPKMERLKGHPIIEEELPSLVSLSIKNFCQDLTLATKTVEVYKILEEYMIRKEDWLFSVYRYDRSKDMLVLDFLNLPLEKRSLRKGEEALPLKGHIKLNDLKLLKKGILSEDFILDDGITEPFLNEKGQKESSNYLILPMSHKRLICLILIGGKDLSKEVERYRFFVRLATLTLFRLSKEERLTDKYKELEVLYRIGIKISTTTKLDEILGIVMDGIKEIVDYNVATIGLLDESRKRFEIYEVRGMTLVQKRWYKTRVPRISEEYVDWALNHNFHEPRLVDSEENPPPLDPGAIKHFLNVPLVFENEFIGILTLGRFQYKQFEDKTVKSITIMASQISGLLEKARKYQAELDRKNLELNALSQEIELIKGCYKITNMVGKNHKMLDIYSLISTIADTDATILIQGETGTGKELIARAIHFNSNRKDKPFVKVNCSAIPETLLESELFGHVKGAFTSAYKDRVGKFGLADKGTLFLDEVGDIPLSIQVKLLRVLQETEFERIGDNRTIKVDVRIIAATNQDLGKLIEDNKFRRDLYYRLNVMPIKVPPLRERKDDIPLLAKHFLKIYSERHQKKISDISPEGMMALMSYDWPGNVRELENIIERAVLMEKESILKKVDLPQPITYLEQGQKFLYTNVPFQIAKRKSEELFEKEYLAKILKKFKGNVSLCAKYAKINRKNLYLKMKRYNLKKEDFKE